MIYIKMMGGLGNQMFQFALGKILANQNNTKLLLDKEFYQNNNSLQHTPRNFELDIYNLIYEEASSKELEKFRNFSLTTKIKKKLHLNYPKSYNEKNFEYNPRLKKMKPPFYLKGYFQSYKYFVGHEDYIHNLFKLPVSMFDKVNLKLLKSIEHSISVAVHIRRGDYVSDPKIKSFHGNLTKKYYLDAISRIEKIDEKLNFIFFSDDTQWVKEEFSYLNHPKTFVDHNKGENSWKDMYLMSKCKHNIIANSSFSWWGAWLNRNKDKKVIAPSNWFSNPSINTVDLMPPDWIRI